jgi:TonB-dependent receptor
VSGAPLIGADIVLDGTRFSAATDRAGEFRLVGVPAGKYELLVVYLGHRDERAALTIEAGRTTPVEVKLAPAQFSETVQVSAESIVQGQASALNQQRTAANIVNIVSADQIGSFPDPNAAEAASRIPGVSIARDQGEGRYVLVRGTEPRLNSMMIDGERIPAPEGALRQVALDAVPADQLQSIEVSKALTPDMDADSIGGAVNLITKQAVSRPTMLFSAAGGYNSLQGDAGQSQFSGTAGRRLNGGRAGLLVGGSASSLNRGSENFEAVYEGNGALNDLQLRDYQIDRQRYGVNVSGDVRAGNGSVFARGIFNEFKDYEVNNRLRYRPPNARLEHVLKNRNQDQHIRSIAAGGQQLFGNQNLIDFRVSWAESIENQPNRLDTIFRQTGIQFAPNVSATSIDPTNIQPNPSANNPATARLNAWETEIFDTTDRDLTGSFNVQIPIGRGSASFLKAGAKVRDKNKNRNFELTAASPAGVVLFPELQDTSFDNSDFLGFFPGSYPKFPGIDAAKSRAMFNALPASRVTVDHEGDAENYDASERVYAGYAMAELFIGDKLMLLPGLRYESTDVDYTGFEVLYNDDGDYESTRAVSGGDANGFLLPALHARYAVNDMTNVRAAFTRTLARPNYFDLVPYQLVFQEDGEISRGNASLVPTSSNNLDFLVERYFHSVGIVSGGVFYKRLNDYIYPFQFRETAFGDLYEVTQPRNGDSASLWGMEIAFQDQLRFLPGPLSGLGVYANYTWTDSDATFPGRSESATLPGQSTHVGNFALSYERSGFSGRASWNLHGKYIDAVGGDASEDVYYDNHTQLDVNLSQRITRNIRGFVDVLNLTNAPLRYYQGVATRPIQEEYYRWWTMFGVKVNF